LGRNLQVTPLAVPKGTGLRRKLDFPVWLARNGRSIWREIRDADAVHAPIPGDVGTIGMVFALLLRKPLFVRHCGNWSLRRTTAEWFWRWAMERFAGGRNVMLATGGSDAAPSAKNQNIGWIFSTSLTAEEIADTAVRQLPADGRIRLIIACRQEKEKGAEIVIEALTQIIHKFPQATLDVVGDGTYLEKLKSLTHALNLDGKTVFHGKVGPKEVVKLLKCSHVFCYPTQSSEGFPKVVLEALASGLPVVTTSVSVLPRLIGRDCGIVINTPNAENVAAAVESIVSSADNYRRMSGNAIAAAQNYSLERWRDSIGDTLRGSWGVASLSSAAEPTKIY
jgi:hypothetical protein